MELRLVSIYYYQILLYGIQEREYGIPQTLIFVQVLQGLSRFSTLEMLLTFRASHRSRLCVPWGMAHHFRDSISKVLRFSWDTYFVPWGASFCSITYCLYWHSWLPSIPRFTPSFFVKQGFKLLPSSRVTWRCYKFLLN